MALFNELWIHMDPPAQHGTSVGMARKFAGPPPRTRAENPETSPVSEMGQALIIEDLQLQTMQDPSIPQEFLKSYIYIISI